MKKKILVVDDEPSIVTLVKFNLEKAGFDVDTAINGKQAIDMSREIDFDLLVLDIMLPELDGFEVLKELRKAKIETPVILLTAKDEEFDKVLGLELGADDYLTKPFSPRELTARVKAILRRFKKSDMKQIDHPVDETIIHIGELTIEEEKFEARINDHLLELTPKEFELLVYMIKNKGRVLKREKLLDAIWGYDYIGETRIVDVHMSHLREKMEEDSKKPKYIKTIRGIGYKFEDVPKQ